MDLLAKIISIFSDYINVILKFVEQFNIFGAFILSALFTIVPIFPIIPIAAINYENYKIVGILMTYLGVVAGNLASFIFIRHFFKDRFKQSTFFNNHTRIDKILKWIDSKDLSAIIISMSFPFTPSTVISYACALSKMAFKDFLIIILTSNIFYIAFTSYIGASLIQIIAKPIQALIAVFITIIFYLISKKIENRFSEK